MSSSSTYSGPDSTRGTDEFTRDVNGLDLLAKRSKLLMALAGLVLILVAVFAFIASQNEQKSDAGRSALYLAEKSLDTQLETIAKASAPAASVTTAKDAKDKKATPPVTAETIQFQKFDVDTQLADSISKLKSVATEYSTTRPGFDAMLILGKTYLNHGNAAAAAEWFRKSAAHAPTALDRALALESVGYAHENEGKYKEALDAFDESLNVGEAALKGDLLLSKARVYESMKNPAQAKATYDLVLGQFPNSEYSKLAELFKARLK